MPVIQGEPVPTAIHRTGFTVTFQTINPGTTIVEYGKTTALGTTVNLPAATTAHSVELTNLEPGTVYYVRVSATNAAGTSRSAAVPMITDTKKRLTARP
ncbi:fibronectin type III domain-containing protein [Hymenobacter sublimis]|uniref:Fibronectin type III domain-containing protein n=1 Tax=Hymenobacter sublimis TaxID=2933777 RepID=A0ABY4J6J0_9BACT|nr:fibronectin type III domain-containing protein [Hymenobacter sublimis]UPL47517.1 fibronectin type III domain-containing protein [Hymenobacter sublimis]